MKTLVDFRANMPPIFDQGSRPTCLAISTSDAHQSYLQEISALSVEYLYYQAVAQCGYVDPQGVSIVEVRAALSQKGQPKEGAWPYGATTPPIEKWKPPENIGKCYKASMHTMDIDIGEIRARILNSVPVILGIVVSRNFTHYTGSDVIAYKVDDQPIGFHAVLAVGSDMRDKPLTLIRNSWGTGWGNHGYAWVEDDFLAHHLKYAATVTPDQTGAV